MTGWQWGTKSLEKRSELHPDLILIVDEVLRVSPFDLTITCGFRGAKEQKEAFDRGTSQLLFPASKHNRRPAEGVDIEPFPLDYENTQRYYILAGMMISKSKEWDIPLRWLGLTSLGDLAHWERTD